MSAFSLDDNQQMLGDSARKYIERGYGRAVRAASLADAHGCAPARWNEFAEMGWLALPLPEAVGGLGGSLADMCVLAEELGRALVVEPWIASGVMAATLLAAAATPVQRAHWLPALAAGERRVAFAAWDTGSRFDAAPVNSVAEAVDGAYRLNGVKELVLGAPGADALIVCAACAGPDGVSRPTLFLLEPGMPGLELQTYAMVDGRHAAHLRMHNVTLAADQRLDPGTDATRVIGLAIDRALVVQCAETTGAMARALEITLDYLKTRKQFGRILAGNQVLQHRLVDLHVAIEETRALVRAAALAFGGAEEERQRYVAAAKAYASQAARLIWEEVVQLQGAIGMTDEYPLGAYVKHLAVSHTLFGDSEQHFERMARVEDRLQAAQ